MKKCSRCKKPSTEFSANKSYCKPCTNEYNRQYYRANKEDHIKKNFDYYKKNQEKYAKKHRSNELKRRYGITSEDYERMLLEQNSSCALCKRHSSEFSKRLAVDHNHKTKQVRGLLCFHCNKFKVGRHNLESAKALYEYMVKYESEDNKSRTG